MPKISNPVSQFNRVSVAILCAALLLVSLPPPPVWSQTTPLPASPAPLTDTIAIDPSAPSHPFPHFWEQMFGSGRAILSLRDGYRSDLRDVKQATGFQYVRFHAIFDDETGVYDEDSSGRPVYNFSYVDQIYDGLLANGVRPLLN